MTTLNVVATIKAKAGSEQLVGDALILLAEATRSEAGCISYELYVSHADACTFITIEEWDDQASLDAHLKTDHIAHALAVTGPLLQQPPDIHPLKPIG